MPNIVQGLSPDRVRLPTWRHMRSVPVYANVPSQALFKTGLHRHIAAALHCQLAGYIYCTYMKLDCTYMHAHVCTMMVSVISLSGIHAIQLSFQDIQLQCFAIRLQGQMQLQLIM